MGCHGGRDADGVGVRAGGATPHLVRTDSSSSTEPLAPPRSYRACCPARVYEAALGMASTLSAEIHTVGSDTEAALPTVYELII